MFDGLVMRKSITATELSSSSGAVRTLRILPGNSIRSPRCIRKMLVIVHLHRHGAHFKQYVRRIGDAEVDHGDGAILIQRRGAHLEDLARQFNPVAAPLD